MIDAHACDHSDEIVPFIDALNPNRDPIKASMFDDHSDAIEHSVIDRIDGLFRGVSLGAESADIQLRDRSQEYVPYKGVQKESHLLSAIDVPKYLQFTDAEKKVCRFDYLPDQRYWCLVLVNC